MVHAFFFKKRNTQEYVTHGAMRHIIIRTFLQLSYTDFHHVIDWASKFVRQALACVSAVYGVALR